VSGEVAARFSLGFAPPGWDNLQRALGAHTAALQAQLVQAGLLIEKDGGGYYDRFRDRIIFPIHDARGRVIGFGGRVLGAELPKYLNSPETPLFHKGHELYGLYQARKASRELERLLVVEGYMDVIALAQHGIEYAVATLGTATTREHLERLFRVVPQVVFCFDGDRAGREAAWRALENSLPVMREGRQAGFLFLPDGEDPDTLVRKEGQAAFEARLAQAVSFSAFFYEGLLKKADITSMDGRARLVELARPLLSKLPEGVFRHMMLMRLAELAHIEVGQLTGIVPQTGSSKRPPKQVSPRTRAASAQRSAPLKMSQVRLAIALLLQQPGLAALAGEPQRFAGFHLPGVDLLVNLLNALQAQPHLNTAALMERWRGQPEADHLMKLAQWRHPVPAEGVEAEFTIALERLYAQGLEQRKQQLIDKSRSGELTPDETAEMKKLFSLSNS